MVEICIEITTQAPEAYSRNPVSVRGGNRQPKSLFVSSEWSFPPLQRPSSTEGSVAAIVHLRGAV